MITAATEARTRGLERLLRKPFERGIFILIAKFLRRSRHSISQTHGGSERYLLVLRKLQNLLYPFILRNKRKIQVHRMDDHVHVDAIFSGEDTFRAGLGNGDLILPEYHTATRRLVNH